MQHDSSVISIAFQNNSELLATGTNKGEIKVWRLLTGACVKKFPTAHNDGITRKLVCLFVFSLNPFFFSFILHFIPFPFFLFI